jgi:hypothetical protein
MSFGALPHQVGLTIDTEVILQRSLLASAGNDAGIFHFCQWLDGMRKRDFASLTPGDLGFDDAVTSI